jgi:putative inorganic carbon (hco3(-)) transporter
VFRNPAIRLAVFYAVSLMFILLNIWFVVKQESMAINLLPFVLMMVLLAIYSVDRVLKLIVFFTPVSLSLSDVLPGLTFDMFLPTEPLLFGVLLLFIIRVSAERGFDREILRHPVSWAIWLYLFWIFITSLTSTMPLISFKFLMVRIWFIVGFYLLGIKLFEDNRNISRFIWIYVTALIIVISYTIFRHAGHGLLNKQAAHWVMTPFFNDHTSYGAVLAMFIPFLTFLSFSKYVPDRGKWISRLVLGILVTAFILSYTRAAWLSLILAAGVYAMIKLHIRFKTMIISLLSVLAVVFVFQKQIVEYLEKNDDESSSNLMEHFSSMSNITSDASNLERINRWGAAVRMFREKPVFGFGPGTYMFKYAPYQLSKDKTIISTNMGDMGNAHSEYLGPLAESGLFGMLTFLLLVIVVLYTAIHTYSRLSDEYLRGILISAFLGLVTYYAHGLMNNFLDTDKVAVPFWGFTAIIVLIDLRSKKQKGDKKA